MSKIISQRAILSQIQEVLTALRQNARFSENAPHQRQSPLLLNLCQLRSTIRESSIGSFAELSCVLIVTPFLEVVRSEETSGAATGAALGALSALLRAGIFGGNRPMAPEAISDIVDGVSSCRFEFTDARHDEVVKMQMMEVLHVAATCDYNHMLADESMWNIVTEYFVHRNTVVHSLTLCHAAEQCLISIVTVVFERFRTLILEGGEQSPKHQSHHVPSTQGQRGFGLPVAVKVIAFLCAQMQTQTTSSQGVAEKVALEKDSARRLCLKLLHTALETAGGKAFAKCPPIQALVRDDVCHSLLTIGRSGHGEVSPEVLTEAMCVVRTLWDAPFRKFLKIQLEAIFIGVFLQHLKSAASAAEAHGDAATHIIESAFDARVAATGFGSSNSNKNSGSASSTGGSQSTDRSHGDRATSHSSGSATPRALEAEIILEALGDLTASASLFVDLFINFDCDLAREDVLESLITLLSTCARSPAPALKAIRTLAMNTLLNGLKAMTMRCDHVHLSLMSEQHHKHPLWLQKLRKRTLKVGAIKFNEKPRAGLQALMEDGLLPTPLTPQSVVKFLRTAPGLDKAVVGSFLGEAGKSVKETTPTTFVGDTAIFHEQVLQCFAASFDFSGQPIVVALRMFLSAFRLPGEAQQIDRVVQAFADMAFQCCVEPRAGILATTDTVYLLAFSIIMLHTDLHNPNIRPEKRMTCADFIKNNTNYGHDISKGRDLPSELLESIFKQISEEEFETHKLSDGSSFSNAKWRDLLRSVEADPSSGIMLSPLHWHHQHRASLNQTTSPTSEDNDEDDVETGTNSENKKIDNELDEDDDGTEVLERARLLRVPSSLPFQSFVSAASAEADAEDDDNTGGGRAIAALENEDEDEEEGPSVAIPSDSDTQSQDDVVYAVDSMLLHLVWRPVMEATAGLFLLGKAQGSAANPDSLRQAVDASLVLAKLLASHKMQAVFDTLVFMLCGFTGLLSPWPNTPEVKDRSSPLVTPSIKSEVSLLRDLVGSPSARMAAVAVFGIAHRLGSSLRHGWQPILRLVFRMRDLHILDPGMLVESDGDLLDPINRRIFNAEVLSQRKKFLKEQRMSQNNDNQKGGLLRWIFGGGGGDGGNNGGSTSSSNKTNRTKHVELWNHGSHTDSEQAPALRSEHSLLNMRNRLNSNNIARNSGGGRAQRNDSVDETGTTEVSTGSESESEESEEETGDDTYAQEDEEMELLIKERSNLRIIATQQVAACQVGEIIWDSREVSEAGLWALLHSLTSAIHAHLPPDEMRCLKPEDGAAPGPVERIDERTGLLPIDVTSVNAPREVYLPPLSSPCLPFAEVLLVEITLRNRDRIATMWPLLKEHYKRRLGGARVVSFGVEKAATGLLRLSARVASRPGMSAQMLSDGLSWLLPNHAHPDVVKALSMHLGSGLLRIVRHTDALVELPPHHWQSIFGILEACSQSIGEGSVRGFEALCLVLHENRLRTCVPATCVKPVRAFLTSQTSSEPLAIASLDLLTVLHTRLAIIATNAVQQSTQSVLSSGIDFPTSRELWSSCWWPVAESIGAGCRDKRINVKLHALSALRDALIKDPHIMTIERSAPEEIHRLIIDLLCPLAEFFFPSEDDEDEEEDEEEEDDDNDDDIENNAEKASIQPTGASSSMKEEEGFEIVAKPVPSEKRAVEVRTLNPLSFEKNVHQGTKSQVLMLEILCKTFLLHLKSILPLPWSKCRFEAEPPFHELWNRILSLLSSALSLQSTVHWVAVEFIKVFLLTVAEMGGFTPGDDTVGRELWEFTWTVLQDSAGSSASTTIAAIQLHLFPGCDFTHPPSPSAPTADKAQALASLPPAHAAAINSAEALAMVLPPDLMALLIESP